MRTVNFIVTITDVDGEYQHKYQNIKAAAKRFKDMSGFDLPDNVNEYQQVSMYGTVVHFESLINRVHLDHQTVYQQVPIEDDDGGNINEDDWSQYDGHHSYGSYGGVEHRMYGDAYLFQDCPGAW